MATQTRIDPNEVTTLCERKRWQERRVNFAACLPSLIKSSAAGIEPAGLQPGEFVAAGVAQANREPVADQPAATAGENRRPSDQARPVLLATAAGRTSNAAVVRGGAGPDRAATDTNGIGGRAQSAAESVDMLVGKERCYKSRPPMGQSWAVLVRVADRWECSR